MERENVASHSQSISTQNQESIPEEIFQAIDTLFDSFPKFKVSADDKIKTGRIYAEALAEYEPVKVRQAVKCLIHTSKFFPTVSEIIQATRPTVDMSNPDKRKATRNHASMCSGMNESEINSYFSDPHNRVDKFDLDMPYFRHLLKTGEEERERYLAKQWPDRRIS